MLTLNTQNYAFYRLRVSMEEYAYEYGIYLGDP